jgi:hypothetical protein
MMKSGIISRFLSCNGKGQESFLSCAVNSENALPNSLNPNRKKSSASKLPCTDANASESSDKSALNYRAPSSNFKNRPLIIAIDPGITGAIAFVKTQPVLSYHAVYDLPTTTTKEGKKRLDLENLAVLISTYSEDVNLAIVEEVGFMKGKEARGSAFVFGFATGAVHGVLAAFNIQIQTVTPAIWKGALGLSADKNQSISKAKTLFPEAVSKLKRKQDHGRAEALLLAYFAWKVVR